VVLAAGPAPVTAPSGVDALDLLLILGTVLLGLAGARRGLLLSAASAVGLIGGLLIGIQVAPRLAKWAVADNGTGPGDALGRRVLAFVLVGIAVMLGEWVAVWVAVGVRRHVYRVRAGPVTGRRIDAAGGAAFEAVAFLLVAWLLASALAVNPVAEWRTQVRGSAVLRAVEALAPDTLRQWSVQLNRLVQQHAMPFFIDPFGAAPVPPASVPPATGRDTVAALGAAGDAVVKIVGTAPSCGRISEGSGFVFAPQHVMTNAHVVAGTRTQEVDVPGEGRLTGRVVLYDPSRDVAVLYVPGLRHAALAFAAEATTGESGAVAGYPGDGPFTVVPARVAGQQRVSGPDIYHAHEVTREVYTLRARVRPGNSGGPLLVDHGRVAGVVFAASVDHPDVGYALTAGEVAGDARTGSTATEAVSTRGCD
jgi:S1-C subfamily serine protease